jgi:hypothetical protein
MESSIAVKTGPVSTPSMILKKNTERCRTMAPNPEVPVKPHGFALNVKKG